MTTLTLIRDSVTQLPRELRASDGDLLLLQAPTTDMGAANKKFVADSIAASPSGSVDLATTWATL